MENNDTLEVIQRIPLDKLRPYPDHPFGVRDDDMMQQTVESIKQFGVLVPGIARPLPDGTFELIAGHRRKQASAVAGLDDMPIIVRDIDRNAATIIMVDSNLQRENILPSEKAKAYKMKLEAIKRQAGRPGKNSAQVGQNFEGKTSRAQIAENSPDSSSQIQRYIRLNELEPELLKLVDEGKIGMTPAVEISYLTPDEQRLLGCCHADVRGCGIQVKHTTAFATSVAAKYILIQFDIQVCFSVSAKWASAMELRSSVPNHRDTEQIHYIPNAAWQLVTETHCASPPICQTSPSAGHFTGCIDKQDCPGLQCQIPTRIVFDIPLQIAWLPQSEFAQGIALVVANINTHILCLFQRHGVQIVLQRDRLLLLGRGSRSCGSSRCRHGHRNRSCCLSNTGLLRFMFGLACHSRLFGAVFFNCTEIQRCIHHNISKHISSAAELCTISGSGKHSAHRCGFRRFEITVTETILRHKSLGAGFRHILIWGIASIRIQLAADYITGVVLSVDGMART